MNKGENVSSVARCGRFKEYRRRRLDTVLGTAHLRVLQYRYCKCRSGTQGWNPISEILSGPVTPELRLLQVSLGAQISYRKAADRQSGDHHGADRGGRAKVRVSRKVWHGNLYGASIALNCFYDGVDIHVMIAEADSRRSTRIEQVREHLAELWSYLTANLTRLINYSREANSLMLSPTSISAAVAVRLPDGEADPDRPPPRIR